jgi:hypothetical protein
MIRTLLLSLLTNLASSCLSLTPCNLYRPAGGGVVSLKDAVTCTCSAATCGGFIYTYLGTGAVPWVGSNG